MPKHILQLDWYLFDVEFSSILRRAHEALAAEIMDTTELAETLLVWMSQCHIGHN